MSRSAIAESGSEFVLRVPWGKVPGLMPGPPKTVYAEIQLSVPSSWVNPSSFVLILLGGWGRQALTLAIAKKNARPLSDRAGSSLRSYCGGRVGTGGGGAGGA